MSNEIKKATKTMKNKNNERIDTLKEKLFELVQKIQSKKQHTVEDKNLLTAMIIEIYSDSVSNGMSKQNQPEDSSLFHIIDKPLENRCNNLFDGLINNKLHFDCLKKLDSYIKMTIVQNTIINLINKKYRKTGIYFNTSKLNSIEILQKDKISELANERKNGHISYDEEKLENLSNNKCFKELLNCTQHYSKLYQIWKSQNPKSSETIEQKDNAENKIKNKLIECLSNQTELNQFNSHNKNILLTCDYYDEPEDVFSNAVSVEDIKIQKDLGEQNNVDIIDYLAHKVGASPENEFSEQILINQVAFPSQTIQLENREKQTKHNSFQEFVNRIKAALTQKGELDLFLYYAMCFAEATNQNDNKADPLMDHLETQDQSVIMGITVIESKGDPNWSEKLSDLGKKLYNEKCLLRVFDDGNIESIEIKDPNGFYQKYFRLTALQFGKVLSSLVPKNGIIK